ncbi:MAG: putative sodium/solute symporter [Acidobacteria bacterium]|nr:putative sodium/solute symporter [Acidobacteriota bacterium]
MSLHLPLLLAYAIGLVALGFYIGRRVRGAADFFVAGRGLGPGLIFATMLAANIGAGSTVGAAGLGYRDGLSAWWWVGSAGLGSIVLAFVVGPRMRSAAATHGLHTVGDYLELRYHRSVRGIVAAALWIGTLAILAGQLIALAWVLNAVAGLPKWAGCLAGGAVMTTYFVAGGLLTSAWVNMVQLIVLMLGFGLAVPLALGAAGGWAATAASIHAPDAYWSAWQGGRSGWHYLLLLGPAFIVSPGLLQKAFGARDDRAVRLGVGLNAVGLLAFAIVPPLCGVIARSLDPGLANHELALPTLLKTHLPPVVGSIGLAALFSAEVSTADALLFMLATSLSRDLYRGFINPRASDADVLRAARWAAVAGGLLGVLLAMVLPTVIGALTVFYSVLNVSLFVPVLGGLFVRRVGTPEALAAIVVGIAVLLVAQFTWLGGWVPAGSPVFAGVMASVVAAAAGVVWRRDSGRA